MNKLPKFMQGLTNIRRANSQQLNWLLVNRCTHRHNYVRHFNCFIKDYNIKERKGFLDIETSNLKANFGIILCWCIADEQGDIYEDWLTKKDIASRYEDKRVVQSCIDTMLEFDRVCGHFSTYFDIPFLRTRALIHNLEFPSQGELYHTDVWKMAKSKLCIHSNRQDTVAEALSGKTIKTRIDQAAWRQAMNGNSKAMEEVLNHCERDVIDLQKNYNKLLPFYRETKTSI